MEELNILNTRNIHRKNNVSAIGTLKKRMQTKFKIQFKDKK